MMQHDCALYLAVDTATPIIASLQALQKAFSEVGVMSSPL
jgi:hypothetical protein